MEFYSFWARSKTIPTGGHTVKFAACVGYSNVSREDALRVANERASRLAHLINTNQPLDYVYNKLPFCEEVLDRFTQDGELATVVSRVHYGATVLNTSKVLFADIDLPHSRLAPKIRRWFSFFKKKETEKEPELPGAEVIDNIERICADSPGLGFRLYRTAAGFRSLATSGPFDLQDNRTIDLLKRLQSDPLYVMLCKRQRCFRARLTPKPHRIGMKHPPFSFPYRDQDQRDAAVRWQSEYDQKSTSYSTCAFVAQIGSAYIAPEVDSIVRLHDHFACAESLPLA